MLVELGQRCGRELPLGARRIELPLSCELLGQMIDSHRSTVDLELLELERRGLIERASRRIVIPERSGVAGCGAEPLLIVIFVLLKERGALVVSDEVDKAQRIARGTVKLPICRPKLAAAQLG